MRCEQCRKVDNDPEHNRHLQKKTEKYELIAKSYDFIRIRGGSYMSLVKNAVDPTKGDLDKFEIRRRIRSYVKNKPKPRGTV